MADNAEGAAEAQMTFKVKASGEKNHTITMNENATVSDLKSKLATEEFENIPIERQRLIYSGRVMKNEDTLTSYKIKTGNTIHLVKSAASNPTPTPSAASQPVPQAIPGNMAAGTPSNDLLAQFTGARYAGLGANLPSANLFGADGGMGAPPSEDQIATMLDDPAMLQQMQRTLENPQVLEQLMNMNPMFRDNPQMREMLSNPALRAMITNPDFIRATAAIRRAQTGAAGAASAFPAPGATDNTPAGAPATGGAAAAAGANNSAQANPFAALLRAPGAGADAAAPGGAGAAPGANMFGLPVTPEILQMMRSMGMGDGADMGMGGFGAGGFGFPGGAATQAPADTRPPEERYADQLQQLNEMGFFDFDQNVSALRRSGGNVQGAVNFLLGG